MTELSLAEDQIVLSAGRAATTISAAVVAATMPGRRMTARAKRYQRSRPASTSGRASFMPHKASRAGETVTDTTAATIAVAAPAIPIDFRNPCGNSVSVASAQATVTAENSTVRPARIIVVAMASPTSAPAGNSSTAFASPKSTPPGPGTCR